MQMTEAEARRMAVDVRTISDEQLAALRKLATGRILSRAGRLATWLHGWCDSEQLSRATAGDQRTLSHCLCLPNLPAYSDVELADATDMLVELSFSGIETTLAPLVDRLMVAAVGMTTDRLRQRAAK